MSVEQKADRQTDRQTHTHAHTDRQKDRQTDRQTDLDFDAWAASCWRDVHALASCFIVGKGVHDFCAVHGCVHCPLDFAVSYAAQVSVGFEMTHRFPEVGGEVAGKTVAAVAIVPLLTKFFGKFCTADLRPAETMVVTVGFELECRVDFVP